MSETPTPTASRSSTPDLTVDQETDIDTELADLSITDVPISNTDRSLLLQAGPSKSEDTDKELERFRNAWKQEVKAQRGAESESNGKGREQNIPRESGSLSSVTTKNVERSPTRTATVVLRDLDEDAEESSVATSMQTSSSKRTIPFPVHQETGDKREQAIALYSRAVEHEQAGKLNEALIMYRKAFKLEGKLLLSSCRSSQTEDSS